VDDAIDDLEDYSFERREEFRREVRTRLDALDRELAQSERDLNEDASEARVEAVAAAREARRAVGRSFERIGDATRDNWETLREEIEDALEAAELRVRELRPDAKPMGGTGGPS
jgi:phosphate uptake regulator